MKESRSEHTALSSHGSLLKDADTKQRALEPRGVRDRAAEHVQRGGHQTIERDDARRDGNRRPSESEMQHRQERRQSGSHHHHHHPHHQHHQQQHGSMKDDSARHNRHSGRTAVLLSLPSALFCGLNGAHKEKGKESTRSCSKPS